MNNYKTKILSSFSHEFRTPLNGAIAPLELSMQNNKIPEDIKENNIKISLISLWILENTLNDFVDLTLFMS